MDTYLEVRKAYRFLHDFHKRLRSNQLKLIKDIDSTMNDFVFSEPIYNVTPKFSQWFQRNWMSDYFPLMNYSLAFASRKNSTYIAIDTYVDEEIADYLNKSKTDFDVKKLSPPEKTTGYMDLNMFKLQKLPEKLNSMDDMFNHCLLYTSPSPRDRTRSRMPSSA